MAGMKSVEVEMVGARDLALVSVADESVWLVVPHRWWDLATLLWWLFVPWDRKAQVKLTLSDGARVSFRAVRVASRYIRVGGIQRVFRGADQ